MRRGASFWFLHLISPASWKTDRIKENFRLGAFHFWNRSLIQSDD